MIRLISRSEEIELKWWTFPGGERNVKIVDSEIIAGVANTYIIECLFKGSDDLIDMMLLVNAIRNANVSPFPVNIALSIPYFPFARQDRVMTVGEPFALQIAVNIIKSCNFDLIFTYDPHSDVLAGMFEPGKLVVHYQYELMKSLIQGLPFYNKNSALISPDAGALKKIYSLAKELDFPVIEASKKRDVKTGEIVKTAIDTKELSSYDVLYVVDDICDGGRTFIELAKVIRDGGFAGELYLCVTHGIFSKGIEVLDIFDGVFTANNMGNVSDSDLRTFNAKKARF
mgnify:CR=1 FL=1